MKKTPKSNKVARRVTLKDLKPTKSQPKGGSRGDDEILVTANPNGHVK